MGENVLGYVAGISEKQEDSSAREFGRKKKGRSSKKAKFAGSLF